MRRKKGITCQSRKLEVTDGSGKELNVSEARTDSRNALAFY